HLLTAPVVPLEEAEAIIERAIAEWLRNPSFGALDLWGPPGVGKSRGVAHRFVDYDREERAEGRRPVLLWTFGGDDGGRSRKGKRSAEDVEDAEESPSRDGLLEERRRTIVKSLRLRGYSGPIHVGRG